MGYYLTGDYYTGGDPGLFGFIGKAIKGAAGIVSKLGIPVVSGVAGIVAGQRRQPLLQLPAPVPILRQSAGLPQVAGRPGGGFVSPLQLRQGGECPGGWHRDKQTGTKCVRNRRMNPANPRALRRAIRRQESFVRLARKALKGSGYTIASRGSRRSSVRIRESGPGSVTVR
jgi:hypothetical protein